MNSFEATKLNLPEIMSRLGYEPVSIKKGKTEYWYNSPFRSEKDASFHTSYVGGKWIWNDFGDSGGTVIDFIIRHANYYSVSQALNYLDGIYNQIGNSIKSKPSFSFQQQFSARSDNQNLSQLEFISASKIQNPQIISYLTLERGIDKEIALKYLDEVRYRNLGNNREYFAIGIKNQSGGFEIRVASDKYQFKKSSLIKKDITLIKGSKANQVVNVFEGMTDFLSLLTILKTDNLHGDSILMHSVNSYDRTKEVIKEEGYKLANTFLDNNKAGREFTVKFKSDFGKTVSVQSDSFLPFVDINEMLQSQMKGVSKQNSFFR